MVLERKWLNETTRCFRFKASFFPCLVLEIIRGDLIAMQNELDELRKKTPGFFTGSFMIIDPDKLGVTEHLDFEALKKLLQSNGFFPVGIRSANESHKANAQNAGLACMNHGKTSSLELIQNKPDTISGTKVITTPIRSGMQVHASDGDLIIIAQVSPGAELVAAGHIHVYGALHGRALAGAYGNKSARIFCRTLEAELVSVAGHYLTKEDMSSLPAPSSMIQIYLENESLQIMAL